MNKSNLTNFVLEYSIQIPGLLNLFNNENAIKAIQIAKSCNINVLGIDSFRFIDETIQPSLENSIDYYDEQNTHLKAISFIKERENSEYFYEIVFDM